MTRVALGLGGPVQPTTGGAYACPSPLGLAPPARPTPSAVVAGMASCATRSAGNADAGRQASSIRPGNPRRKRSRSLLSSPLSVPAVPGLSPVLSPELSAVRPAGNPFTDKDLDADPLTLSPVPARFCLARPFQTAAPAARSVEIGAGSMARHRPAGPPCVRSGAQEANLPREDRFRHRRPQRPTQPRPCRPAAHRLQQCRHRAQVCALQGNTGV